MSSNRANTYKDPIYFEEFTKKYSKLETGFSDWEKDLFDLLTDEFDKKISSDDETEFYFALQKVNSWLLATSMYHALFFKSNEEIERAKEDLSKAKQIAEEKDFTSLADGIDSIKQDLYNM